MADLTMVGAGSDVRYDARFSRALVVADDGTRGALAAAALREGGCAVLTPVGFGEAAADRRLLAGIDLLWIDGAGVAPDVLDLMLARADAVAGERQLGLIVSVMPDQIDAVSAHLLVPGVELLCDPSAADRASAVACARWRAGPQVQDMSRDREAARLERLHEEVARLADILVRIARGEDDENERVRAPERLYRGADEVEPVDVSASEIRGLIRARRLRGQFFQDGLFEDPAWDMLLDLFAAELERRRVSVSSLCIAAAVAPTTALRWIGKMHQAELFDRQADPNDRRRAYISLTPKASVALRHYVAAARRHGLPLA